jgi:hypothetical protein
LQYQFFLLSHFKPSDPVLVLLYFCLLTVYTISDRNQSYFITHIQITII